IRMLETPLLAIERSQHEIIKMADGNAKMLDWLLQLRESDNPDKALGNRLKHREQVLDAIQDEVAAFVTGLLSGNVPHSVADEARRQLRLADEYESVSDYIADLDKFDRKLRRDGHRFSPEQRSQFAELHKHLTEYLGEVNKALLQKNRNVLKNTEAASARIRQEVKQLRRLHLEDLSHGAMAPVVSVAYLATLNAYSRVLDHAYNIAETIAGEK
ncbi:MAG: Na/Pi cotransporter family protein, partial [Planctomycetales bacterium]|nr:Na/Pi cotransporter family protein [Planctomycetales bacterium]